MGEEGVELLLGRLPFRLGRLQLQGHARLARQSLPLFLLGGPLLGPLRVVLLSRAESSHGKHLRRLLVPSGSNEGFGVARFFLGGGLAGARGLRPGRDASQRAICRSTSRRSDGGSAASTAGST